ncbi:MULTISPECIES: hypothetical protein [unclassified Streptomyces]|uniref:hypothetical protein n=1 Tax=unclassified Streptomyces TaxID=2593676 RepID=UPI00224E3626|nr:MULTISPECIES: hypothetical protein [unclassified Streptomyces]WSU26868.1 hypothetical protein OG508_39070 [Streptomyces sp. NBC_01108]MCX4792373.1 hypothetical protein [Streptomyces sp. NBC_01221]MCX4799751.1 hypothetical protein [Streptomyces sp. NBC_01242]WSJ41504.1 hypothetical protein OG772_36845 [Streptomyces sp. NBC_01321]WSP67863.1 hypothetical protein OG466_39555 [Streptomyces sp. NBC_01240]
MKGTWKNPAIGSVRANGVVIAPEAGVLPLLFIEVDNCAEEAVLIAAKFDKYARFFKRKEKDTDGIEEPPWRTRWSAPASEGYGSTDCGRKFEEQAAAQKAGGWFSRFRIRPGQARPPTTRQAHGARRRAE